MQSSSSKEDDDDFLKEGRKQTEERLQKALARVKSMVQYPEARDQYRRLLNVVNDMQETKVIHLFCQLQLPVCNAGFFSGHLLQIFLQE